MGAETVSICLPKALINPLRIWFGYAILPMPDRRSRKSLSELYHSLFTYINGFYNSVRPHLHNNGLPPDQKEAVNARLVIFFVNYKPTESPTLAQTAELNLLLVYPSSFLFFSLKTSSRALTYIFSII